MKRLLMTGLLLFGAILSGKAAMAKKIDKEALASKIKELEGLDAEERSELLGLLNERKKYGLVWEEKPEAVEETMREQLPVLTEVKDRAIVASAPSATNHILIEGDNLHALTCLTYTHSNKVDVIYIDPPYNTGNKDFVYNDRFVDKEDAFRHSKWLSFMEKRLRIAKGLLSDKGVIFISIDDNEQAQLKLLCDEIFGEENFVAVMPRLTKRAGKTTNAIAVNHDYVLCYTKITKAYFRTLPFQDPKYKYVDEHQSERGKYALSQTLDYDTLGYVYSLDYPIVIDGVTYYPGGVSKNAFLERKRERPKNGFRWRWSKELFDFGLANGFVVLKKGKNGSRIYTKTYERATIKREDGLYKVAVSDKGKNASTLDLIDNVFSNDNARKDLDKIFADKAFDYAKPESLIERLVFLSTSSVSTILDFFAGSGTTLHAVMKLNAEDGGKRTCILVTNNENGICEKVTYERNRRVIQGYVNAKGEEVPGLQDNSLRYYKMEFVPRRPSPRNARALMAASVDLLCIKNDLYDEVPRFFGKKLKASAGRYFDDGLGKRMLVLFDETTVPSVAAVLRDASFKGKVKIYVFAHGDYAYNEEFEEVADKVELCALPAAILNAYRRVVGKYRSREEGVE
ncbi:MAG: site-specific DNA-methyltransferase [Kiritimatiellae bacterium]|nr:site-specific DNA-methyltransferase [Kiritimatiellia bacterium]